MYNRSMRPQRFFASIFILFAILAWTLGGARRVKGQEETNTPEVKATQPPATEPAQTEPPIPSATVTDTATSTASPTNTATVENKALHFSDQYVNDEVLIRFNSTRAKERWDSDMKALGAEVEDEIEHIGVFRLKIPAGTVDLFIAAMQNKSGVQFVEPNYYVHALDTIPNDTYYPAAGLFEGQYGLRSIRAPQGWDISTGSSSVIIAIVDSGADLTHPDLAGKIVGGVLGKGKDFVNNDDIAQDDFGHGTHVAGIAAASSNNNTGVSGVSWGAKIMPVKVLNSGGTGTVGNVAAGIDWAANNGAQIINLSFGSPISSGTIQTAINNAYGQEVTIVASSGNNNGAVTYPAAYSNVIAVGATDNTNSRYTLSNFGSELDLVAPGVNIYSTYLPNTYINYTGTSMAAPFVSGAAAILRGYISSPAAIQAQLQNTALDLGAAGYDNYYGYGLIQLDKALFPFAPSPTSTFTPIPGNFGSSSSYGKGPFYQPFPILTNTPINTTTITASIPEPSQGITPSETSTQSANNEGSTPTFTPTQTNELQAQTTTGSWFIPCLGVLCLLCGIFLLFWLRDKDKKSKRIGWY